MSDMFRFWAKSSAMESAVPSHSVPHHCLDVAACAFVLSHIMPPPGGLPPATIAALVALHDIGKFTRTFQAKVETLWPADVLGPLERVPGAPHDQAGYKLLRDSLFDAIKPLFAQWELGEEQPVLRAIAGHHGSPPADDAKFLRPCEADAACIAAACRFIAATLDLLAPPPLPRLPDAMADREIARLAWWLAGLTTLADWIGSNTRWFWPAQLPPEDLSAYWHEIALPRAEAAVRSAGLIPWRPRPYAGLTALFPGIIVPRPLQAWAGQVAIPDGPALFVIEDATGAGKTEAALVLAHRLIEAGRGAGLYVALPTMATASAIYDRLADAYAHLFAPANGTGRPSLVLAHGKRALDSRFTDSIGLEQAAAAEDGNGADAADEPAGAQCAAWVADDRRKAFLAQIGVGTIDQALMAILPVRHAMLRLLGLSRRVLIIDEAHAYDPYVTRELCELLRFHAALGGSAIVLSATLTKAQRNRLADAFRAGLGRTEAPLSQTAYPLASVVSAAGVMEEPIAASAARQVAVERIGTAEEAAEALILAAEAGAAVVWIRNTVDDALAAAALLAERNVTPILFHARFAMGDRLKIEAEVLRLFGKHSGPADRAGRILVATQVVEQSLDLDFDLMVSDLAPADLVIQRAGRVWRHQRGARPLAVARLLLLSPDPVPDPQADWLGPTLRGTGFVYSDHALLWRSARALLRTGHIETPANIRALVEEAHDNAAGGAVPDGLAGASAKATGKDHAAAGIAAQNVLRFVPAYRRDAGRWEPDEQTPTRLTDETVTLRLARIEAGRIRPWHDDPDPRRAWSLSEITVRRNRATGPAPDPEDEALLVPERAHWGKWEREMPVLVMRKSADGYWQCGIIRVNEQTGLVSYGRRRGLIFLPSD